MADGLPGAGLSARAAIIKEFNGQDFTPAIAELVKEANKPGREKP